MLGVAGTAPSFGGAAFEADRHRQCTAVLETASQSLDQGTVVYQALVLGVMGRGLAHRDKSADKLAIFRFGSYYGVKKSLLCP
jgi:hypothetical protein